MSLYEEFADPIANMKGNWRKYFAWFPVEINGSRYWLTPVYRRPNYVNDIQWGWEYGTILDVLKEE